MSGPLTEKIMLSALRALDVRLDGPVTLIIGGGGAMILAHGFPLSTSDIDAFPKKMEIAQLDVFVKEVARAEHLPPDWLNPYFSSFTHTLPSDYSDRLILVFEGKRIEALALGKEEMLIMKCFAHRQKDVGHARALIKKGADIGFVESHIEKLKQKGIPGCEAALDFLDELIE